MKKGFLIGVALLLLLACALPFLVSSYRCFQFTLVLIYAIALLGLNILTGYNGQISLGHAAFMAIGGYTAAVLILGEEGFKLVGQEPAGILREHGMRPIWTIPIAALVTGVIGYLFGLPALRLAGVSLALATFAVADRAPGPADAPAHEHPGDDEQDRSRHPRLVVEPVRR